MIASRLLTPARVQLVKVTKKSMRTMPICKAKKKQCDEESPNPYALFDSTVKLMSTPATEPIVEEMKRTNEALEKIVDILQEYKLRKLNGLVPVEQLMDSMNKSEDEHK